MPKETFMLRLQADASGTSVVEVSSVTETFSQRAFRNWLQEMNSESLRERLRRKVEKEIEEEEKVGAGIL